MGRRAAHATVGLSDCPTVAASPLTVLLSDCRTVAALPPPSSYPLTILPSCRLTVLPSHGLLRRRRGVGTKATRMIRPAPPMRLLAW